MNKLSRTMAAIALVMLGIVACDDGISTGPAGPLPPLTVADFPMDVGSHWVYHVVDTLSGDEDTVDVTITSEQFDSAGKAVTVWQYSYRNGVFRSENVFVSVLGDSVWFSSNLSWPPYQTIVFPLSTGKAWWHESRFGWDSSLVMGEETVHTPSSRYRAFRIETVTSFAALDPLRWSNLWLSTRVGIVRVLLITGFRRPDSAAIWTLLDYEPPIGD